MSKNDVFRKIFIFKAMTTKNIQSETMPFNWNGWDKQDELVHTYYNVSFTGKFGIFEPGDKFSSITVDYGKGIIEAYEDTMNKEKDIEPIKIQIFKAIAIKQKT